MKSLKIAKKATELATGAVALGALGTIDIGNVGATISPIAKQMPTIANITAASMTLEAARGLKAPRRRTKK